MLIISQRVLILQDKDFITASQNIRLTQLSILHYLGVLNKQLVSPKKQLNINDTDHLLDYYNYLVGEIKELDVLIDSYKEFGIYMSDVILDRILSRRAHRIAAMSSRIIKRLNKLKSSMSVKKPVLKFNNSGHLA